MHLKHEGIHGLRMNRSSRYT